MIDLMLLIFSPVLAWERIAGTRRSVWFLVLCHLVPLLGLICVGEGYGLMVWGRSRPFLSHPYQFPFGEAVLFEALQFVLMLGSVLVGAQLLQTLGSTFHGRHKYQQALTTAVYGLTPLFFLRFFNMFPAVPIWLVWALGMFFSIRALYPGLPRIMEPDPPHAFGLFLMGAGLLTVIMGLVRFIGAFYIQGKIPNLEQSILSLTGHGG
jgi:hypothetical protein